MSAVSIAASDMLACSSSSSSSSERIGLPSASYSSSFSFEPASDDTAEVSTTGSSPSSSSWLPNVASRSITSRSRMSSDRSSSRQMVIAWNVSGLSQSPRIIVLRPASIRFAIAISPSRDSNSTLPISRRYIRTGSSVRSSFSVSPPERATSRLPPTATRSVPPALSSDSSDSSSSVT